MSEDGNEDEDWGELYNVLTGYDRGDMPLFEQCAYSQFFLKKAEPQEWDNENNG